MVKKNEKKFSLGQNRTRVNLRKKKVTKKVSQIDKISTKEQNKLSKVEESKREQITNSKIIQESEKDEEEKQLQIALNDLVNPFMDINKINETINILAIKNKINLNNAFQLPVIDIRLLDTFLNINKNHEFNWSKVSSSLQNSAKIYGFKVDSLNKQMFRVNAQLHKKKKPEQKEQKLELIQLQNFPTLFQDDIGKSTLQTSVKALSNDNTNQDYEYNNPYYQRIKRLLDDNTLDGLLLNQLMFDQSTKLIIDKNTKQIAPKIKKDLFPYYRQNQLKVIPKPISFSKLVQNQKNDLNSLLKKYNSKQLFINEDPNKIKKIEQELKSQNKKRFLQFDKNNLFDSNNFYNYDLDEQQEGFIFVKSQIRNQQHKILNNMSYKMDEEFKYQQRPKNQILEEFNQNCSMIGTARKLKLQLSNSKNQNKQEQFEKNYLEGQPIDFDQDIIEQRREVLKQTKLDNNSPQQYQNQKIQTLFLMHPQDIISFDKLYYLQDINSAKRNTRFQSKNHHKKAKKQKKYRSSQYVKQVIKTIIKKQNNKQTFLKSIIELKDQDSISLSVQSCFLTFLHLANQNSHIRLANSQDFSNLVIKEQ